MKEKEKKKSVGGREGAKDRERERERERERHLEVGGNTRKMSDLTVVERYIYEQTV